MSAAPAKVRAAWVRSIALQTEYPDLLDLEWSQDAAGTWAAQRADVTISAEPEALLFLHAKHGRIKVVPA